jgi:rifampicin phosphotransferase
MSSLATHLIWLNKAGRSDRSLVGSKAANLGELFRLGLPVPEGVCVTTAGYDYFLRKAGIVFDLNEIVTSKNSDLCSLSSSARALIYGAEIPELLRDQIAQAHRALNLGNHSCFAVRSSSLDEDLVQDSFAGLYESYLQVRDLEEVLERIRDCWASFWSQRALEYRAARGLSNRPIVGAVIVQKMIDAEAAGVLFTKNPVENGNLSMALEVVRGTGEQVVSGAVTPDRYVITKSKVQIVSRQVAIHDHQFSLVSAGSRSDGRIPPSGSLEILSNDEVLDLCRIGLTIERAFGQAQDIEWTKSNGRFYFLQARPVTFTYDDLEESPDASVWTRENINERFPDPLKPLEASFVNEWVFTPGCAELFRSLAFDESKAGDVFRLFGSRLYVNKRLFASALKGLPPEITRQIFERDGHPAKGLPKIVPSLPLLLTLARVLKMAFTTHRKFAQRLGRFLKRYHHFRSCDYSKMPLEQLARELIAIGDSIQAISAGHFQSIIVAEILLGALTGVCQEKDILLLVRGREDNKTVEMNKRFEELCKAAAGNEVIYSALMIEDSDVALAELRTRSESRHFLWLLNWFLDDFGHRSPKYQLSHPRWKEKPAQVLNLIRTSISALSHLDSGDLGESDLQELERAAEQNLVSSSLDKVFPWKKAAFRLLLRYARIYCGILRENEGFYITMPFPEVKRILSAIAVELVAASMLQESADIYYLTIREVVDLAIRKPAEEIHHRIAMRKQAFSRDCLAPSEAPAPSSAILSGAAASPGMTSGPARILFSPTDGFEPGSILVTHSLNAAWLPILRSAGAVVTNVGGMLSHAAVLAREFRVPAVLGAKAATATIEQNQKITVDGTNGKVFLNTM